MENANSKGVVITPTSKASKGINAVNNALENGNPIEVGVDYKKEQVNNLAPNGDGMTDHFIVVSSKTETLSIINLYRKTLVSISPSLL